MTHCRTCEAEIVTPPSRPRRFCSPPCYRAWQAKQRKKVCAVCGKSFDAGHNSWRQRSCSQKCGAVLRRKVHTRVCGICGNTFQARRKQLTKYCSGFCRSRALSLAKEWRGAAIAKADGNYSTAVRVLEASPRSKDLAAPFFDRGHGCREPARLLPTGPGSYQCLD